MSKLSDAGLDLETYVEGLKAELDNAKRAGHKNVDAILAELKRVGAPAKETATQAAPSTPEG